MKIIVIISLYVATLLAMEPLVNAQWLQKSLNDKNLVLIDVSDRNIYEQGHIPKSINSPISHWRKKHGNFLLVKELQAIQKEFQRLGINKNSKLVIYSHHSNTKDILKASYVIWAMEYYGFKNSAMLNGGLIAWREFKGNISYNNTLALQKGTFNVKQNNNLIADLTLVQSKIGKSNMLDARPTEFYFGVQQQIVLAKAGHIPKAKSYFWRYSFEGDYLKNKNLLKKMLIEGMELDPNKSTITYCTGGLETSMNFFVLHRLLGFNNIRRYDASMREWANSKNTPMTLYKWE
jgi:thiosulfate/3-mercaptopyruvate sulfurtransferase